MGHSLCTSAANSKVKSRPAGGQLLSHLHLLDTASPFVQHPVSACILIGPCSASELVKASAVHEMGGEMPQSWSEVAAEKRAIRAWKLANDYASPADNDALEDLIFSAQDAQDLVKLIENHKISAKNVTLAHIRK